MYSTYACIRVCSCNVNISDDAKVSGGPALGNWRESAVQAFLWITSSGAIGGQNSLIGGISDPNGSKQASWLRPGTERALKMGNAEVVVLWERTG